MPRIQEYGSQVQAANPALDLSARPIEQAGQMGRTIQKLGGAVADVGEAVYRRQSQEEQDNAQVDAAMNRSEMSTSIDEQIKKGNVDVDGTLEKYTDMVDGQADKYQTREGRRMFHRQAEINRAMIFRTAADARAHLAGENAKLAQEDILNHDSITVENDPTSYPDIMHSRLDAIGQQVDSGNLDSVTADKLKMMHGKELARAAVRGWAKRIEDGGNGPEIAEGMLNGTKENGFKGAYDEVLDSDSKAQLSHLIHAYKSARETDANRVKRIEGEAQAKRAEAWKIDNLDNLEKNLLRPQDVIKAAQNGTLQWGDAKEMLGMIDRNVKQNVKTDQRTMRDLTMRIHLPEDDPNAITSIRQLENETQGQFIKQTDWNVLAKGIDATPEGRGRKANKKILLDYMKSQLVKTDKMLGISDPEGEQAFASAFQSLNAMEEQYRQEKKPVESLYDSNSKDSFYSRVLAFKKSPKDIMRINMDRMRGQNDAKGAAEKADKEKATLPRNPGETPEAWLLRKRKSEGG